MIAPNFYLDSEFIECAKQRRILGVPVGRPVDTVDLISLALVSDDGRELYCLNRECELEYAWANEWVRENVLRAIYEQHVLESRREGSPFALHTLHFIFGWIGKTRAEIARQVIQFVFPAARLAASWNTAHDSTLAVSDGEDGILNSLGVYHSRQEVLSHLQKRRDYQPPIFKTYYGAYDWVCFCQSLFGCMNDLPAGFPKYSFNLKQEQDRLGMSKEVKRELCPNPEGEHNPLIDARWNRQFDKALQLYAAAQPPAA